MRIFGVFILVSFACTVYGQSQLTLYQMNSVVPQSSTIDPSVEQDSKIAIGLPIVSGVYLGLGSPLSYSDIFSAGADDSLQINTSRILQELRSNNKIELDGNIGILYFGLDTQLGTFSLTYNSTVDGSVAVPGKLLEFAISGAENSEDLSTITLNETDMQISWYNEWAVGFSTHISNKWRVGGRVKYLQGMANASINGLNGVIEANIDTIHLSTNPWAFNTAGFNKMEEFSNSYFFNTQNKGWGLDLGATYLIKDNLSVTASVVDLGSITWREDTKSYNFNGIDYSFDGLDLLELIQEDNTVIEDELDSLKTLVTPEEVEGTVYTTPTVPKFYIGARYTLAKNHTFGLVVAGEAFKSRVYPLVGITYNIQVGKILNAGINVAYRNNAPNLGLGISGKFGPIQLYALADSFETVVFSATDTKVFSARVGLNILVGESN